MNRTTMLSIATFLSILATPAWGQPDVHAKLAEELLVAIGTPLSIERSLPEMVQAQVTQAPELALYRDLLLAFYKETVSWEQMKDDLVRLYTRAFTVGELRRMLDFYRSDVGRKALEQLPSLSAQGAQLALRKVQQHLPELQRRIDAEKTRMQGQKP